MYFFVLCETLTVFFNKELNKDFNNRKKNIIKM